ncbi:SUMF1/EgtB/PvdO family nonheme iron enzyme, partial [uncultured Helicobacter sp.]|uniref:SUMF1/EgtB/PvdO family nonheme iron enzyme n=1 Tax=uncultured Helicobacter sp. TaxID=175537 RepID=UPI00259A5107
MPKDADFNAGEGKGVEPVNARDNVLSTSGAINVLGNVWEWTSTSRQVRGHVGDYKAVKGGAWDSKRTECRTENR